MILSIILALFGYFCIGLIITALVFLIGDILMMRRMTEYLGKRVLGVGGYIL